VWALSREAPRRALPVLRRLTPLERIPDQLGLIAQPELAHEVGPVGLDGADADRQLGRDLRIRVAVGGEGRHLSLSDGQVR
jgi:hypothetical protein